MHGILTGFDAPDGAGKATQAEMLRKRLESSGKPVTVVSFPRYADTHFGRGLREALDGKYGDFIALPPEVASVPYALDRWASKPIITDALEAGHHVILDRYVSANQIHQGGKFRNVSERIKFLESLDRLEFGILGMPRPDAMFYLDVPPEISVALMKERGKLDGAESNVQHIEASYEAAQWLVSTYPMRWIHIRCVEDGKLRTREDIHEEVFRRLTERFSLRL